MMRRDEGGQYINGVVSISDVHALHCFPCVMCVRPCRPMSFKRVESSPTITSDNQLSPSRSAAIPHPQESASSAT